MCSPGTSRQRSQCRGCHSCGEALGLPGPRGAHSQVTLVPYQYHGYIIGVLHLLDLHPARKKVRASQWAASMAASRTLTERHRNTEGQGSPQDPRSSSPILVDVLKELGVFYVNIQKKPSPVHIYLSHMELYSSWPTISKGPVGTSHQ